MSPADAKAAQRPAYIAAMHITGSHATKKEKS